MFLTFLFAPFLCSLPISNFNKKKPISEKSWEYLIVVDESQNFENRPQLNDFDKPSTMWIVIASIIGVVFVVILVFMIYNCCKRCNDKRVGNSVLFNQSDDPAITPQYNDQQIYFQNLQNQAFQQQMIQHNLEQQQLIFQNNLQQQQQQFYQPPTNFN